MKKPKKCRHAWYETKRSGNFWAGVLTVMEQCTKCNDVRLRPGTADEIEIEQNNYSCPICKGNHRPTNPLHEGCIMALVGRVHALEVAKEELEQGLER